MRSKIANKVLTGILCVGLMLQMSMPIAYAEETTSIQETKTVTAFADLAEEVKNITVPMGTTEEELALPEAVTATVGSNSDGAPVSIPVTWGSDKTFSSEEAGEFIYTAKLTEERYTLAESVKMPSITVNVVNQPAMLFTQTPAMTLIEGAVDGRDINIKGLELNKNTPTVVTQYKAGAGYVLFTPASKATSGKNTIELNNATLEAPQKVGSVDVPFLMVFPSGDVDLIIKGENKLIRDRNCTIYGRNCNLKVTGEGTLSATNGDILLEDESTFHCDENTSEHLNLMVMTRNSTGNKQEIFGSATDNSLYNGGYINLILHKNAELTLQNDFDSILLYGNLDIAENAKLIIDKDTILKIEADGGVLPVLTNNGGSILVKGQLIFGDSSYSKDITKMNITTEGTGTVVINGIDPVTGKIKFNDSEGIRLSGTNGGEYSCDKGTMKWEPVVDDQGELISGTLTLNNAEIIMKDDNKGAITVDEGKSVPITLNLIGNNTIENPYSTGIDIDDLTLTGSGTLTGKCEEAIVYGKKFDTSQFSGKLNALVLKMVSDPSHGRLWYGTAYGIISYRNGEHCTSLTVEKEAELTIEPGSELNANALTNNGSIINNGTLGLLRAVGDAELKNWVYDSLNVKGNGIVQVNQAGGSAHALFTNGGQLINETVDTPLDFSNATEDQGNLAKDGYHWDNQNRKLTFENLNMWGNPSSNGICAITLPEGKAVTLELKGYNKITGFKSAVYQGHAGITDPSSMPEAKGSLTICGDGTLVAENQAYDSINHENILTTTGKLILQSGNLLLASSGKNGLASVGMEIKGGSIGSENVSASISSFGDFTMSSGKLITCSDDVSIQVDGNLTLSGGELINRQSVCGISIINGGLTITGGKLTIQNDKNGLSTGIAVGISGNEDKKISISGGTVDIKAGMAAVAFSSYLGVKGKAIIETNGMTLTTNPEGGTLKSVTISMPMPNDEDEEISQTMYALTADDSLKLSKYGFANACTSLIVAKASSNGGSSGHHSGGGSGSTVKQPDTAKQEGKPAQNETPKSLEAVKKDGAEKVKSFKDVKERSWFYEGAVYALGNGWFAGTTEATFSPSNPMTREMFRIVIGRMGADANDLMDNNRLKENITREQLATLLYRMAQKKGLVKADNLNKDIVNTGSQNTQNLSDFADGAQVSAWAKEAMVWANAQGIIKGNDRNMITPKAGTNRAEVAVMLMRFDTIARNHK